MIWDSLSTWSGKGGIEIKPPQLAATGSAGIWVLLRNVNALLMLLVFVLHVMSINEQALRVALAVQLVVLLARWACHLPLTILWCKR
jgi:hypothetical protein